MVAGLAGWAVGEHPADLLEELGAEAFDADNALTRGGLDGCLVEVDVDDSFAAGACLPEGGDLAGHPGFGVQGLDVGPGAGEPVRRSRTSAMA